MGIFNLAKSGKSPSPALVRLVALCGLAVVLPAVVNAGQIDSSAFFHLRRGMSESEVLVRAGPPDLVTSPGQEVVQVRHGVVDRGDDGDVSFDSFQRTRYSRPRVVGTTTASDSGSVRSEVS